MKQTPPAMTTTPVKLHHTPKWLKQRIAQRVGRGCDLHDAIQRTASDLPPSYWLDHWGSTKLDNGDVAFVSEPYGLNTEAMQGVLRFAYVLGLRVSVRAASEWNPSGGTIRVEFTPNDREDVR